MPYFTMEDFSLLNNMGGVRKDSSNQKHAEAYEAGKKTYDLVKRWAELLQDKLFPDGPKPVVRRKPTDQAQQFMTYYWAKIRPFSDSSQKLAYTVTINKDGFVTCIDTIGLDDNSELRKKYIRLRDSSSISITSTISREDGLALSSLEKLAEWSVASISKFSISYGEVAKRLNLEDDSVESLEPTTTATDKEPVLSSVTIYEQIASQGFCFPDWLVTDYILALGTKPFVILSGISGTGKTKLAQIVAQIVAPDEEVQSVFGDSPKAQDGSFIHTVGLSTLKYRGLTLPVDSLTLFNNLPERGEGVDVAIQRPDGGKYKGRIANVNFTDSSRSTVFRLFWEKDLGTWLTENSSIGDYLLITPLGSIESQAVVMELHKATRISKKISSPRIAFLSVRPDWTDNRSLLGYYNPLTGQYQSTELLSLLLRAEADPDKPHFVILDEMNLAKVEYYFSDFLSAMEAETDMILHDSKADLFLDEEDSVKIPRRISIPKNVFFTGTVNVDETTYMFSPKVLDRSNVIEFNEVNLQSYPEIASETNEFRLQSKISIEEILEAAQPPSSADWVNLQDFYKDRLRQAQNLLAPHHLHFGYRVVNEISCFMNLAAKFLEEKDLDLAFDLQLLQKVFPKLAGNRAKLEKPLSELLQWCNNPDLPRQIDAFVESDEPNTPTYLHSAAKLTRMLKTLKTTGFVSFVE